METQVKNYRYYKVSILNNNLLCMDREKQLRERNTARELEQVEGDWWCTYNYIFEDFIKKNGSKTSKT